MDSCFNRVVLVDLDSLHLRPLSLDCLDNHVCLDVSSSSHYCDCTYVFQWSWYWDSSVHPNDTVWILSHDCLSEVVWIIHFTWSKVQVLLGCKWLCWMKHLILHHLVRITCVEPVYFLIFEWMVLVNSLYNVFCCSLRCVICVDSIVVFNLIRLLGCTNTLVVRSLKVFMKVTLFDVLKIFFDSNF